MLKKESWKEWKKSVIEIFIDALKELRTMEPLPGKEDELSRELLKLVRQSLFKWCKKNGRPMQGTPYFNIPHQPDAEKNAPHPSENKRPDFTWGFKDYLNPTPVFYKSFEVECKRLREDKYSYCAAYINKGVKRFTDEEWSYGKGCESGLMIGYVQELEFKEILHWINRYAQKHELPLLVLQGHWQPEDVSRLEHTLKRPRIPISPFCLTHLWVDLRE